MSVGVDERIIPVSKVVAKVGQAEAVGEVRQAEVVGAGAGAGAGAGEAG